MRAALFLAHANVMVPTGVERFLRRFLVTPDMHRIHHSIRLEEIDCNFGFQASWWDKLFGTYRAHPKDGQWGMTLGLADHRDDGRLGLAALLLLPFRGR